MASMLPRVPLDKVSRDGSTKIFVATKDHAPNLPRLEGQKVPVNDRAMHKLGVSDEIVKMEKLMKKLGICDHDLEEFKQLQRHSGNLVETGTLTKEEILMGFSVKQMHRVKALKRLGVSEQDVWDAYAHKISQLGAQLHIKPASRKAISRT
ncbi:hypothetical protein SPRG_02552 [Saprolegnia parasitica CBS 223.65]|uniref:Uncharacterized protein n=1 Tax=Saprolegnia parasitica (strain CBS 223.65) TaxID=695850 RepID=A0A067CQ87_SAPPC|nr:hypothetical protein SPRG_02552 [Saprolegnia parasitica CBS 223.65]KDO32859.1 hypothetical protein SPRG_02552 [Saprolegnia parasitica CBS 223.65]|eukprot:XP_012196511.1 hypothetical protein SPRG_02552 [Saprolegnia parasitica CBS 223.65]